jgi:hypothetical protein
MFLQLFHEKLAGTVLITHSSEEDNNRYNNLLSATEE